VTTVGPFRLGCSESTYHLSFIEKPLVDNGRFTLLRSTAGVEVAENNLVTFTPEYCLSEVRNPDPFYQTCFGPCLHHAGRIYGATNHNLSLALTRLTAARPDSPISGRSHAELVRAQREFVRTHKKAYTDYGHLLARAVGAFDDMFLETYELIQKPHPKKRLRMAAWNELIKRNLLAHDVWMTSTQGSVKRKELGKGGNKKPRLVNSLSTQASLLGILVTSLYKHAMAEVDFVYKGHRAKFIGSPKPTELSQAFEHIIMGKGYEFIYYSDDSCIGVMEDGERRFYNADIANCDTSHTGDMFSTLLMASRGKARSILRRLIAQCRTPLVIKTRLAPKQSVTFIPNEPVMYSGTTLTTFLNNLANLAIFMAVVDARASTREEIMLAAEDSGYTITAERCDFPEDLQFLKHSPSMNGNSATAVLNAGVILRASGKCKEDVPGRKTELFRLRAERQQRNSQACYAKIPQHDILRAMYRGPGVADSQESWLLASVVADYADAVDTPWIESSHFLKRYRLSPSEWAGLVTCLSVAGFGDVIRCSAGDKILGKDYGM
jgi:hypothetical protein